MEQHQEPDEGEAEKWLEYKGYVASVQCDEEDGFWHGTVLNADTDLLLIEALTLEDLQADFQETIDDYETIKQQKFSRITFGC